MEVATEFWNGLSQEARSYTVQIVVVVLGAMAVIWHIGYQAKKAIETNRDVERTKLQLKIFEDIYSVLSAVGTAENEIDTEIYAYRFSANVYKAMEQVGNVPPPSNVSFEKLEQAFDQYSRAHGDAILVLNQWQIIDRRSRIFATAIADAYHNVQQAKIGYQSVASLHYPRAGVQWLPPTPAQFKKIEEASDILTSALLQYGCFIRDIGVEVQKLLLADLFDTTHVEYREPIGPRIVVIRLDRYDELTKHFENNTALAKSQKEAEKRVWTDMEKHSSSPRSN